MSCPRPPISAWAEAAVRAAPLLAKSGGASTNHVIVESIHAVRLAPSQERGLAANSALRWCRGPDSRASFSPVRTGGGSARILRAQPLSDA